ncbi:MAG: methyltransferase [Calditrichaeota bacterium]|nr:MAG: methyltransferase [Calditrichota bacterium]
MPNQINPSQIMQIGMGFWASKTLLSAVKLGLFTHLNGTPLTAQELGDRMGLHKRGTVDFFDTLVSLGLLQREGNGENARYTNTPETALFLDKDRPEYIGGVLEMANDRLYPFWGNLEEGLKTGQPQNEIKQRGENFFEGLYSDPERLRQFMEAMSAVQMGNFITLAEKFDFSPYHTLCDLGGAAGLLSIQVASRHPHMQCLSFDLPPVEPIARENIAKSGLAARVTAVAGNFFEDPIPRADVITMGNVLHDWNLENKKLLIQKAYNALPEGGALIVIENIIDDERRENTFGLLMSLNMLIEVGDGFDFTKADFDSWAKEIGFQKTKVMPLTGPASAVIAYK